ncbi:HEPN domain-containing protein [Methanolacinia petrolearia]|uniref:HEPN domain-containing protein n=1 Tax=Methanolacinia petrolearia TaxID=54120 RepID=UPI000691449E|nr:HEPN domain-containing protein [Methanolacinia petrolearia]
MWLNRIWWGKELSSLFYSIIVKIKEMSLRDIISASFVDREIEEAEYLFGKNHHRAAGALAGVALEQHLRTLCDKYQIDYGKKDTIEPLVQKLYKNNKLDSTQMKNIQHLASIRDKCDHPSEIKKEEVKELIERVKKIV